jgi:hypothetical protein
MIWVAGRSPTLVSQNLKTTTLTYLAIESSGDPPEVQKIEAESQQLQTPGVELGAPTLLQLPIQKGNVGSDPADAF